MDNKRLNVSIPALIVLLLSPALGLATTFFVSTTGNDSYNGLSPAYSSGANGPFRTLDRASQAVRAGDTVQIRGGTYTQMSSWNTSGTQAAPIVITNYGDERVVIDGANNTLPSSEYGVLLAIDGDWYELSDLEIGHSGYYGLTVMGSHCLLDNIFCHHSYAAGITMAGSYNTAQNCRAWYNSTRHELGAGDKWSTGLSIMGSAGSPAYYSVIRNCTAWENWGQGIKAGYSYYATVEDCVAYDNMYNFYVRDSRHCLFQKNLSYCNPGSSMVRSVTVVPLLIGDEGTSFGSSDNTFVNNLVLGGERYNVSIGGGTFENGLFAYNTLANSINLDGTNYNLRIGDGTYTNARIVNNIILQDGTASIAVNLAAGISFSHNNWSKTPPSNCRGTGDIVANPQLAESGPVGPGTLTREWFRILDSSPSKDQAIWLAGVPEDVVGTPRGDVPDIGAFEIAADDPPLTASASGSPTAGGLPLAVSFAGRADGGASPYSFSWDFGDGGSSSSQNPSHTYLSAGTFLATLTVVDGNHAASSSSVNIRVTANAPLVASASAAPTSGQAPLAVNFTGQASGGDSPYSFRWTFGDGGSSTSQNPAHSYASAGTYTATLLVTDGLSVSATATVSISVTSLPPLDAGITASSSLGPPPLTVNFAGIASGGAPPYSYNWSFGDGAVSTAQSPSHIYRSSGSYIAVLQVTDSHSEKVSASIRIVVETRARLGDPRGLKRGQIKR